MDQARNLHYDVQEAYSTPVTSHAIGHNGVQTPRASSSSVSERDAVKNIPLEAGTNRIRTVAQYRKGRSGTRQRWMRDPGHRPSVSVSQ